MTKIWFTADTHFNHKRTLELSKRPYQTVEEMNNDMIEKWNSVVKEDDIVYHLGDFGDFEFIEKLNGKIILLYGNYEFAYYKDNPLAKERDLIDKYGFLSVHKDKEITTSFGDKVYSIVHEPTHATSGNFYLFGHIHKLQMVKKNGLNVGVDCHNFYPIDLETIEFYRNAIENHYDHDVFSH